MKFQVKLFPSQKRLQLAMSHSFKHAPFFDEFEKIINECYNFFETRGHKRKEYLRTISEELQEPLFKLNYIYKVC